MFAEAKIPIIKFLTKIILLKNHPFNFEFKQPSVYIW